MTETGETQGEVIRALWRDWYAGTVKHFHDYRVFNGVSHVPCRKLRAGMAKKAAEDWADRLMNERVHITLEGKAEQAWFDRFREENRFALRMNRFQELCFALGTGAMVLRIEGLPVDREGRPSGNAAGLKLDFVTAEGIYPLSWQGEEVRDCAFARELTEKGERFCYLQIHLREEGGSRIENRLYRMQGGCLTPAALEEVPALRGVAESFETGCGCPLFFIDRPNITNNFSPESPMGVSIFANAVDQLKVCDNVYDSFNSEITLGRKRVMVKPESIRSLDGEPYFDPNDLVFYILPEDARNGSTVQEMQATLRTEEHLEAMQMALDMLSLKCGFGANHWRFDSGEIKTATQVISTNSAEFRTLKKHELLLEDLLIRLARAVLELGNRFCGQKLKEDVDVSVDFDDSVIEDEESLFNRDLRMLSAGVMGRAEFRMKWRNEDEATARGAVAEIEGQSSKFKVQSLNQRED